MHYEAISNLNVKNIVDNIIFQLISEQQILVMDIVQSKKGNNLFTVDIEELRNVYNKIHIFQCLTNNFNFFIALA